MLPYGTASAPDGNAVAALRAAFLSGEACDLSAIRPEVRAAWVRSRTAGVDPELKEVPVLLEGPALREYQIHHELYRAGLPAARDAAALLEDTGYAIFVADAQGLVLYTGGDRTMLRHAGRVGSLPGASWREDLVGNNAVGTSLVTGEPTEFRAAEHWSAGWGDWACFAAPVRDPASGTTLGTLALVSRWDAAGAHALQWVSQAAGSLAAQVTDFRGTRLDLLRAQARQLQRWFPDSGLVAVAPGGRVVWSAGPVPAGLPELLEREGLPAGWGARLEERMLPIAGGLPCLLIPVWQAADLLGHVLVIPGGPQQGGPALRQSHGLRKIVAVRDGRAMLFDPHDVIALFVLGGRVYVLTDSGRWPTPYHSLQEVAHHLEGPFFQADRGTLVNLDRVREIHPMFNRTVTLIMADRQGTAIPVSRRRTAALRSLLRI